MYKKEQKLLDGKWVNVKQYEDTDKKELIRKTMDFMINLGGKEEWSNPNKHISTSPDGTERTIRIW